MNITHRKYHSTQRTSAASLRSIITPPRWFEGLRRAMLLRQQPLCTSSSVCNEGPRGVVIVSRSYAINPLIRWSSCSVSHSVRVEPLVLPRLWREIKSGGTGKCIHWREFKRYHSTQRMDSLARVQEISLNAANGFTGESSRVVVATLVFGVSNCRGEPPLTWQDRNLARLRAEFPCLHVTSV
ncbi:hypothetical protein BC835DRAFT_253686 [Cytidiella melzeri]|nr:hypothetical protein BC835DRAFT_253686 [Cytidiella melzeri]